MEKAVAEEFFSTIFGGMHHIPGEIKPFGRGWIVSTYDSQLSTFDFDMLTRLVFLAHDKCVRVELLSGGPRRVRIAIHQRFKREGNIFERHPSLEQALSAWRGRGHQTAECPPCLADP